MPEAAALQPAQAVEWEDTGFQSAVIPLQRQDPGSNRSPGQKTQWPAPAEAGDRTEPRADVAGSVAVQGRLEPEQKKAENQDLSDLQRLVIPDLGVDARIVTKPFTGETWDITGLRADIGWLEGTSHPGQGGNTVLAGHIMVRYLGKGPFRYLDRLKPGARLLLYTNQMVYTYQVREQALVKETDGQVTGNTHQPQLTLLTCSNWDTETESYLRRRAVFADLMRVLPNSKNTPDNERLSK